MPDVARQSREEMESEVNWGAGAEMYMKSKEINKAVSAVPEEWGLQVLPWAGWDKVEFCKSAGKSFKRINRCQGGPLGFSEVEQSSRVCKMSADSVSLIVSFLSI